MSANEEGSSMSTEKENTPSEKKNDGKTKEQISGEECRPPLLVDLVISVSGMLTILMTVIVAVISYFSGTTWLNVLIRTVVTLIVVGGLFWLLSLKVALGSMEAVTRSVGEDGQSQVSENVRSTTG